MTHRVLKMALLCAVVATVAACSAAAPAPAEPLPGYYRQIRIRLGPFAIHDDGSTPCTVVTQPEDATISMGPTDISEGTYYCAGIAQGEWVHGTPPGGVKTTSGSGLVTNGAPHCLKNEVAVITSRYNDAYGRAGVRWDCYLTAP